MLCRNATHFFNYHGRYCSNYEDAPLLLCLSYKRSNNRTRVRTQQKIVYLSEEFARVPNKQKMEVIGGFRSQLKQLQRQHLVAYNEYRYLRDKKLTVFGNPWVNISPHNRVRVRLHKLSNKSPIACQIRGESQKSLWRIWLTITPRMKSKWELSTPCIHLGSHTLATPIETKTMETWCQ